jgi:hypothetical protein
MVVGAFAQAQNNNNDREAVTRSLIEMERQWSESASPAEEVKVVQFRQTPALRSTRRYAPCYLASKAVAF